VALRYADALAPVSQAVAYIGDVSLVQSLWRVACAEGLVARVQVLPAESVRHADRRRLAEHLAAQIAAALAR
jgi:1-acyl-sn-glycerol-3-phosphate acyltransferase